MDSSKKDFNQAWNELTTRGELYGKAYKSFTPIGIRKNVKEVGYFYHGTKASLQIGDLITPGYPSNYGTRKINIFVKIFLNLRSLSDEVNFCSNGTGILYDRFGEGSVAVYIVVFPNTIMKLSYPETFTDGSLTIDL